MRLCRPFLLRIALAAVCGAMWIAAASCNGAPKFHAQTLEGERFTNESLKGSMTLVAFWTTWCPYCRRDQPAVDEIARRFAPSGLIVLAVNVGESKDKVLEYLRTSPRHCRVVASEDTDLAEVLGARSFPYYAVIGRDGAVAATQSGSGGEEGLLDLLARAGVEDAANPSR
jgi:thiol-disulfide isomerase/thioredoxin